MFLWGNWKICWCCSHPVNREKLSRPCAGLLFKRVLMFWYVHQFSNTPRRSVVNYSFCADRRFGDFKGFPNVEIFRGNLGSPLEPPEKTSPRSPWKSYILQMADVKTWGWLPFRRSDQPRLDAAEGKVSGESQDIVRVEGGRWKASRSASRRWPDQRAMVKSYVKSFP